ncbi:Xaa-Pro aminopeptidase [Archaeoglobus sulfaticallidus PM70-1]|uniref:Xaa-Pro aminopeptidase n=1 Tax=Archaeoglobus sulfaticallidus PM70-1 TaxID=387631 RepID=N0BD77_9EURY|nr:Xaa-Pro peptidase family protein [Archaeoglobus sulfaticallidus]AGK61559.1 Xaa-Pro aminopeptidase [Archaeoglobus sulfaticallidus PM70-1]
MIPEILREHNAQFFVMYDSSRNANFYYSTGFQIPDPAFYMIGDDGTDLLVVSEMEKRRAERESKVKEIASLNDIGFYEIYKELKDPHIALAQTLYELIRTHGGKKILVPREFPSFLSFYFKERMDVEVIPNPFSRLRMIKRGNEIEKIRQTSKAILEAMDFTLKIIRKVSSCEELRNKIEVFLFKKGFLAENTIVSSGTLSADPHYIGMGEIEDHLIVDIFPRSRENLYFSDFTRTVLLNDNAEIAEMLEAVIEAKNKAISIIHDGVLASEIHNLVCDVLEGKGYGTLRKKSVEGFLHSTGHGIGLEVHEEPRIYMNDEVIRKGMVFTVEPGLYYRKIGGVRVEDTVVVKKDGCEVLTPYRDFIKITGV